MNSSCLQALPRTEYIPSEITKDLMLQESNSGSGLYGSSNVTNHWKLRYCLEFTEVFRRGQDFQLNSII